MLDVASLINLLGFAVGVALYALLLLMVARYRSQDAKIDYLLLITAFLGLLWNTGELFTFIWRDFMQTEISPLLTAASFSALGFLPSVVVHSAEKSGQKLNWLTYIAYFLSVFAAVLHFQSAIFEQISPSSFALQILTVGSLTLLVGLIVTNLKQTLEKKAIWITALLVFAASALHLSNQTENNFWLIELVAHQSSLPLALAILLQDYRFAFADLFLKRAISLILLALTAFGLYIFVAAPLLHYHETHDRNDVQAIGLIITLWVATALIYPFLHRFAIWLVDKIILQRANYASVQNELAGEIEKINSASEILQTMTEKLAEILTARKAVWTENVSKAEELKFGAVSFSPNSAKISIPTVEAPFYQINLTDFRGGRRLLSEEISLLEAVGLIAARRIDALRVVHERCELEIREQELAKLATEAQLSALRAQINPHFLFNALTTIGYLIQTAPDKAFQTLMRLTQLLRFVLRSNQEFCTLEEEINLIENYLDIERTRFEERLQVEFHVSKELKKLKIPSLILQPLVENAIKHGISKNKRGGKVDISAELESEKSDIFLLLTVADSGAGSATSDVSQSNGIGLKNIKKRLQTYYGNSAQLAFESSLKGTKAEIKLPVKAQAISYK